MTRLQETLKAHHISLSDGVADHEFRRAINLSGGVPGYVRDLHGLDSAAETLTMVEATPLGSRFVGAVDQALSQAEEAANAADSGEQLTAAQVELFERGFGPPPVDPQAQAALELAAMQMTALTVEEAASLVGNTAEQVRERVAERSLYSIQLGQEHRLPIFQLDETGQPIPHLSEVLPHLNPQLHPVGVLHWFNEPSPDLSCEATQYASLSPRAWLLRDLPLAPVRELAKHAV